MRVNAERIFPYLGGEEVNTSPTQTFERYVISFGEMPHEQADRWPELMRIVLADRVRPERARTKDAQTFPWWQFWRPRNELYAAIGRLPRCLVTGIISKHVMFSFQPTDRIFSHKLYVFPLDCFTAFAVLQSRVHEPWAWLLSSTMRDAGINYSASVCFETFPFPKPDPRTVLPDLETAGQALYEVRAKFMVDTQQGLTKTYNALKDPSCTNPRILELRRLHEATDRAVLDAYGWTDIAVPPYCPLSDADKQAIQAFEDEVIDRLYVLNAERARDEERLGLAGRKAKRAPSADENDEATAPTTRPRRSRRGKKARQDRGPRPRTRGKLFA